MYVLYEVLLYLVLLLTLPYFLLTGILRGKYLANVPQRLGFFRGAAEAHDLWIHAVSVGETLAARPVVERIRRLRPETSIVFTTTTLTGQAQARRLYPDATVTYFPFDFAFAVRRFLDHHRPRVFATMETEIWPNVTRIARARGLRLVLANGRISDRSFPRYRLFRRIVAGVLRKYDRILAREETDRTRFVSIGAPDDIVEVSGNVKFDYEPDETPLEIAPRLEQLIGARQVLVLGSTMEGEDEALLPELERLLAEHHAFVIIAPRKPERFELVAGLLATSPLRFVRRTELADGASADVLLLDTLGELAKIYRYATAAFVGGTLINAGGHNPIEPAAAGVPVCFGPSMSNFREIAQVFLRNEAAAEVSSASEAIDFAASMFDDAYLRASWGERARRTVQQNRGASERTARRIVELLA
ncbi:MAG: 3-deoxy-D-manno-octulosonic acid transferase [Acidobacteria bacterium]|nr:3-deoxy-D-manno-octulosonic acid transferase [Acidobacteriota bacterium]MBV9475760.1 3-deoxy-D-manno-octulosonic acid transferase [Acidobacteriota bacterium]